MKLLFLLASSLLLVGSESKGVKWPKVLLIGDSITQGSFDLTAPWSAHLANYFIRKADVVNRGIGGYTTRGYKNVFDTAVAELDPKAVGAVVIFLGANDCVNNNNPGHVPIPEYKDNLKILITKLKAFGVEKDRVIIASPAPVFNRNDRNPTPYVDAAKNTADSEHVTFVDVYNPLFPHKDKLFVDGLHFNANGAKMFFDIIRPPIEQKLLGYKGVKNLPDNFPNP